MAWKLLQLTPLKPFFFGKESVFTNTHYATSEYFPQQTQIAGALRLYWMEQNNLMRVHKDGKYVPFEKKEEARTLVGSAGSLDFGSNTDLGALLSISPMFILQKENKCIKDALFEVPSDIVKYDCELAIARPKRLQNIISSKAVVLLEKYDVKEGFVEGLGGSAFWKSYINYESLGCITKHSQVFEPYKQVGIALAEEKQVDEGKFYTKTSYNLKEGYTLALLANIDNELLEDKGLKILEDGILSLGADSSMFQMEVCDIPAIFAEHPLLLSLQNPYKKEGSKIVLLSDSILTQSIQEKSFYQIVPYKVPFKMMQSREVDPNTSNDIEHKASYSKTSERLLVPKGSVYYFKTPQHLEEATCAYKKMGFNQYLTIN